MIYLITYDLKTPKRNYEGLYEAIKRASSWWHYLESTWIVKTSESVSDFSRRLNEQLGENDRLLVVNITNADRNGWLPKKAWEWIREKDGNQ